MGAAAELLPAWALRRITLTRAYVNSFTDRKGRERHDVLMEVEEAADVEYARQAHLRAKFKNHSEFSMNKPRVTHAIFGTRQEAEAAAIACNEFLPRKVEIVGVTIE